MRSRKLLKILYVFFNGTPVLKLPPTAKFHGTGVYAIYYIGKSKLYTDISKKNRLEFSLPIYVGKAVPRGWRQSRNESDIEKKTHELNGRLREHAKSIIQSNNLEVEDFHCRFMILEGSASSLISTVEAALIRFYVPFWNSQLDGFGNHDPGKGRYNQAKSEWDIIHPGRGWADKCLGTTLEPAVIEEKIYEYFKNKKKK
jgi:hypothetical protein